MKIAYISLHWPRLKSSSIGKKISLQNHTWEKLGHTVGFFSHMHTAENKKELVAGSHFIYEQKSGILGFIGTEFNRIAAAKKLIKAVAQFHPEIIYLRWSMYVFPIHRLARIAPLVIEINTNDLMEHRLLGVVLDYYNRFTRRFTLASANGLVFATRELSNDPSFTKFRKPFVVVPNGIELDKTPFYSAPDNKTPRLVFIGTAGMAWQGADKLVDFALRFSDIHIDLVGFNAINGIAAIPENISLHGYLKGKALEAVLANADAAIGTMALHRKGMREAASLKTRDVAARGIPTILPYEDTAISGLNLKEILHIRNSADNLQTHGQEMHDFIYAMRGKRIERSSLQGKISIDFLESTRLDFFKQCI